MLEMSDWISPPGGGNYRIIYTKIFSDAESLPRESGPDPGNTTSESTAGFSRHPARQNTQSRDTVGLVSRGNAMPTNASTRISGN